MAQKMRLWLPALVWMGVIFGFSALPINHEAQFSWPDFIFKKTAHVAEYAILYFLVHRAWSNQGKLASTKIFILSLVFGVFYAMTDEWHQTLTPGREGRLKDVGFDTLGMLLMLTYLKSKL